MTEYTYLWDGTVTGDAGEAPYDKQEFNRYVHGIHNIIYSFDGNDVGRIYVIPGYLNNLVPAGGGSSGGFVVTVDTGAALLNNYLYINNAKLTLSIDEVTAGYKRKDLIVLQADINNQEVRCIIVKGTETTGVPSNPSLTFNASLIQVALAEIFVDDSSSYLADKYVYDTRYFAQTNYSLHTFAKFTHNLIRNSEFMAYSSSDGTTPPEEWAELVPGTGMSITATDRFDEMSRGQTLRFSDESLKQNFVYPPYLDAKVFSVIGLLEGSGSSRVSTVTLKDSKGTVLKTLEFTAYADGPIRFNVVYAGSEDVFELQVDDVGGTYTQLGQFIIVPGYHPGIFRTFNEWIGFNEAVTDTSWDGDAKSTGTTNIDLSTDFGGLIKNQTKSVMLRLRGNDSGSLASTTARIYIQTTISSVNYGQLYLSGIPNDEPRENVCTVPVNKTMQSAREEIPRFKIGIIASGAGTLDTTVEIVGVEI